jgi:hypothetical protein
VAVHFDFAAITKECPKPVRQRAGGLGILSLAGDINRISPHYFYRDRLIETYLRTERSVGRRTQVTFKSAEGVGGRAAAEDAAKSTD